MTMQPYQGQATPSYPQELRLSGQEGLGRAHRGGGGDLTHGQGWGALMGSHWKREVGVGILSAHEPHWFCSVPGALTGGTEGLPPSLLHQGLGPP